MYSTIVTYTTICTFYTWLYVLTFDGYTWSGVPTCTCTFYVDEFIRKCSMDEEKKYCRPAKERERTKFVIDIPERENWPWCCRWPGDRVGRRRNTPGYAPLARQVVNIVHVYRSAHYILYSLYVQHIMFIMHFFFSIHSNV